MSKVTDVIAAMRDAGGSKERLTAGWLELSRKHKGLHDALKAVFARKPTVQNLGLWLSKNIDATHGELTLAGRHSTHSKAHRYAVRAPGDLPEARKKPEKEPPEPPYVGPWGQELIEAVGADRLRVLPQDVDKIMAAGSFGTVRYNRELERAEKRKEKADAKAAEPPLSPEALEYLRKPLHEAHTPPEPERDWHFETRDGQMVKVKNFPLPPPKAAPVVEKPAKPLTRVEEMRARYVEHHANAHAGSSGFHDPGGVVSHNIENEHGQHRNYCKVAGKWPGGFGR